MWRPNKRSLLLWSTTKRRGLSFSSNLKVPAMRAGSTATRALIVLIGNRRLTQQAATRQLAATPADPRAADDVSRVSVTIEESTVT